jgi:hypothetical protein
MRRILRLLLVQLLTGLFLFQHEINNVVDAIQIKTTSGRLSMSPISIPSTTTKTTTKTNNKVVVSPLQDFISRPIHWPDIVFSSDSVEVIKNQKQSSSGKKNTSSFLQRILTDKSNTQDKTDDRLSSSSSSSSSSSILQVGDIVNEYFALNQLQVQWECIKNEPNQLIVSSINGLDGIATDCIMNFEFSSENDNDAIDNDKESSTVVQLTMEYTPTSPIAIIATPILIIDNWIALNILLPIAIDTKPLNSYRTLMGNLYGIAGIAHLYDILFGGSQLFLSAGVSPFENLSFNGQIYAIVWCIMGPIAYGLSKISTKNNAINNNNNNNDDSKMIQTINLADIGLILYGIVEVVGAVLISTTSTSTTTTISSSSSDVLYNACIVQFIVFVAWVYSYQKQQQQPQQ